MGGSQSQERVVNVEETSEEDGGGGVTVSEDFLRYLQGKVGREEGESHDKEDQERHDDDALPPPYYSGADKLPAGAESASGQHYRPGEAEKWKMKYEIERRKNESFKDISSREFDRATKEIKERFDSITKAPVVCVCEDRKDKVLDCYHSNPGRPLNCTEEAKDFLQCVEKARQKTLHTNSTQ